MAPACERPIAWTVRASEGFRSPTSMPEELSQGFGSTSIALGPFLPLGGAHVRTRRDRNQDKKALAPASGERPAGLRVAAIPLTGMR